MCPRVAPRARRRPISDRLDPLTGDLDGAVDECPGLHPDETGRAAGAHDLDRVALSECEQRPHGHGDGVLDAFLLERDLYRRMVESLLR
jgi:hypothetical protein